VSALIHLPNRSKNSYSVILGGSSLITSLVFGFFTSALASTVDATPDGTITPAFSKTALDGLKIGALAREMSMVP
jgi:hypothetical protein